MRMTPEHTDLNTTLYIVRHGESLDNAGIPHVRTPEGSELTDRGRQQAHTVARELAGVHADAVIASNLLRARQTAEIIAADRHLEVRIIPELHERSVGSFIGRENLRHLEEYRERYDAYDNGSEKDRMAWKLGEDWESLGEALERFVRAVTRVAVEYRDQTVIVVAHGTVMRTFLIFAGFGTLNQLPEGTVDNTGYIVVKTDGRRWTIIDSHGVHRADDLAPAARSREE
jgi:broad specificity phosphatase PhoE